MICRQRQREGSYICRLPEGHEHEGLDHHATLQNFRGDCTCYECVATWLQGQNVVAVWSVVEGEAIKRPAFKNPPDRRTTKAARLP